TLRAPGPGDEDFARAAQAVLQAEGFDFGFLAPGERWPDHLAGLERGRLGLDLAPGRVPATFLYADVDGQVVGRASVRHALTDQLLRQSLVVARAEGVGRVLVTCDDDNLGSIAVIERCGGRRDVEWPGDDGTRRYWIA